MLISGRVWKLEKATIAKGNKTWARAETVRRLIARAEHLFGALVLWDLGSARNRFIQFMFNYKVPHRQDQKDMRTDVAYVPLGSLARGFCFNFPEPFIVLQKKMIHSFNKYYWAATVCQKLCMASDIYQWAKQTWS